MNEKRTPGRGKKEKRLDGAARPLLAETKGRKPKVIAASGKVWKNRGVQRKEGGKQRGEKKRGLT